MIKSRSDKDKNRENTWLIKIKHRPEKNLRKHKVRKYKHLRKQNTWNQNTWGNKPKGLITNAVRQKDIRDKIVGILKTQNFNLDVNYEKHEAKVTLSNGQVIIFTFKEEKKPEADKPADKQPGMI
ncbi:hypothetical protein HYE35_03975 [Mycoplasmopsis bovis]|nr:hypothetical protein [Mycoplasmopsis bovis]QQH21763.1 hypothetical protein HYE35_03975 [Mycoplasmopsis bovis]